MWTTGVVQNFLVVQPVTIGAAFDLAGFALATPTYSGCLQCSFGLYANNAGFPTNLVASVSGNCLTTGSTREQFLTAAEEVPAGDYWIGGRFGQCSSSNSDMSIRADGSNNVRTIVKSHYSSSLPNQFGTPTIDFTLFELAIWGFGS